jgi:hypothetical protein
MTAPSRPAFVDTLLARPLPPLTPAKLSESANPPYSAALQAQIANAGVHPTLEAVLHILNDDLFGAHFLLRKLQAEPRAKWAHGLLHAREGDVLNAKCWYRDAPLSALAPAYADKRSASRALDRLTLALGKGAARARKDTEDAGFVVDEAYTLAELEALENEKHLEENARKDLWREMTALFGALEDEHGWVPVDGTLAYTKDPPELKEQNRVLGEGVRTF